MPTGAMANERRDVAADAWSNQELVAGLAQGDPAAAAAFFDKYQEYVNKLVWKLLGDDSEHDDVVNNAFVDVLRSAHRIENPEALTAFVGSVTINAVRRELRKRKVRLLYTPLSDRMDCSPSKGAPQADVMRARVYRIIEQMGVELRVVFVLRFIEGYTFEEVAKLRGYSLATAKRKGKKARAEFVRRARRDAVLVPLVEGMDDDG